MNKIARACACLLCLLTLCAVAACSEKLRGSETAESGDVSRVEINYRDFKQLSYVAYTEAALLKSKDIQLTLTETKDISQILAVMPKQCLEDVNYSKEKMDLHLLVKAVAKNEKVQAWKFSKFHYSIDADSFPCKLSNESRDSIENVILSLAKGEKKAE